ncbi:hypothetical protein LOTGIDRAFT_229456 [Lottia gigantea]|uniref:Uncharacterized protein n=1 Tax=Lottia gigantea TaxID=225164 RepID=V3Z4H2_LOTGI|nr:hypothetical protein LOTGIDRAFT_229456 [Lottia gigantea]ESO85578.1 hypothetical protein LOTGIDRAFT_229456 [Lottia gigantea]
MYIIVKYGNNESLLCNPNSAVINLLSSIKSRAGFANTNKILDLSDETEYKLKFLTLTKFGVESLYAPLYIINSVTKSLGLVKELDAHKKDYASKFLSSHTTYVLVEKELLEDGHILKDVTPVTVGSKEFVYTPLLDEYAELFPEFKVHVQEIELRKQRRQLTKSPSPAGRFPKSKRTQNKQKSKRSTTPRE